MVSSAWVSLLLIIVCTVGSWCQQPALKVTHLEVPPYVHRGEDVKLRCVYFNQNKGINSIKWFFNDEQFFRYMPYEDPPTEFYLQQGENGEPKINIDLSRSNGTEVYLTNVNLSASGTYRCMVTEDAPFFRDDSKEANLTVTDSRNLMSTNRNLFIFLSLFLLCCTVVLTVVVKM